MFTNARTIHFVIDQLACIRCDGDSAPKSASHHNFHGLPQIASIAASRINDENSMFRRLHSFMINSSSRTLTLNESM